MSQFVTDTHPLVWHLTGQARLSAEVKKIFTEADAGLHQVLVPGIVLIEIVYLSEKGVIPTSLLQLLFSLLSTPGGSYAVASLDQIVAQTMAEHVPWSAIPELADRVITATAVALNFPLITTDGRIRQSGLVSVLW